MSYLHAITAIYLILRLGQPTGNPAIVLIDVAKLKAAFAFDIRYATPENFAGKRVYPVARCLIRREVAPKLVAAARWLTVHQPGWRLLFKDCYRPDRYQRILWQAVAGTLKAAYVANPNTATGSMHSYGAAVDLTLLDGSGHEVDMGTAYDELSPLAEPRRERQFLAAGRLTKAQVAHRLILKMAMKAGGMLPIPNEWWHFDDAPKTVVRHKFTRLDLDFSAIP